jgi:hypothetical protein
MNADEREAERVALEELLRSDGWEVFTRLVSEQYSPSRCLAEIDAAMSGLKPGDDEVAVVTQIRAAWKLPPVILDLPSARVRELREGRQAAKPSHDPFALFRRRQVRV